jgi:O-antigen/teichoic acid export membrane protein
LFREILRKSATYSVAIVVSRILGFAMLPIYTRYLSPADYGVMELLDVTVNVIGLVAGSRLGQALFYFYFAAEGEEAGRTCISTTLAATVMVAAGLALAALPAAGALSSLVFGSARYASFLRLTLGTFACSLVLESGFCWMRMMGRSGQYVRATLANLGISVCLGVVLLAGFGMGLKGLLVAGLAASAFVAAYVLWSAVSANGARIDRGLLLRIFLYSLPLGVSGLSVFVIHYGDRIFLRSQVPLSQIGIYSLAYKLGMAISFLHAPFSLHWMARVSAVVRSPDGRRIYVKALTYLTVVLTSAAVFLALFARPVVSLLTTPAFHGAAALAPWIGLAYLLRSLGAHLQGAFTAEGKPNAELRANGLGAIVCLIAYATLIPRFKLWGAVAATLIGFLVILIYTYWEAQRMRYYCFEYRRLLQTAGIALAFVSCFHLLRPSGVLAELAAGVLAMVLYTCAIIFGVFEREERVAAVAAVKSALKNLHAAEPVAEVAA